MKSYEKMVNDLYERRDNYLAERRTKNKITVRTLGAALCVGLVAFASVGVFGLGWFKAKDGTAVPPDVPSITDNAGTDAPTNGTDKTNTAISGVPDAGDEYTSGIGGPDSVGYLDISGVKYVQIGTRSKAEEYTKKDLLGKASDFPGFYKELAAKDGVDGEVYSVNESVKTVLVYLSNGGVIVLSSEKTVNATGEKITEEEARRYFEENSASLIASLSANGVSTNEIKISDRGYSHVNRDDNAVSQNFRDYLVYCGDRLTAIITLAKDNGAISATPAFGAHWFDNYDAFLKEHTGEKLLYLYAGFVEIVIAPDNTCSNPMGLDVSEYLKGIDTPYDWFYDEAAVYIP